jgi:hypothetical protein
VRLSANFPCPERRSTDGQVILERTSGRSENRLDLLRCGAPLRNRTVDLLLTMYRSTVLQSQVERLSCANTSTGWHSQAPDEPTRAPFATQSATHFDLADEPSYGWSILTPMTGRYAFTVSVRGLRPQTVYGRHAVLQGWAEQRNADGRVRRAATPHRTATTGDHRLDAGVSGRGLRALARKDCDHHSHDLRLVP